MTKKKKGISPGHNEVWEQPQCNCQIFPLRQKVHCQRCFKYYRLVQSVLFSGKPRI